MIFSFYLYALCYSQTSPLGVPLYAFGSQTFGLAILHLFFFAFFGFQKVETNRKRLLLVERLRRQTVRCCRVWRFPTNRYYIFAAHPKGFLPSQCSNPTDYMNKKRTPCGMFFFVIEGSNVPGDIQLLFLFAVFIEEISIFFNSMHF